MQELPLHNVQQSDTAGNSRGMFAYHARLLWEICKEQLHLWAVQERAKGIGIIDPVTLPSEGLPTVCLWLHPLDPLHPIRNPEPTSHERLISSSFRSLRVEGLGRWGMNVTQVQGFYLDSNLSSGNPLGCRQMIKWNYPEGTQQWEKRRGQLEESKKVPKVYAQHYA